MVAGPAAGDRRVSVPAGPDGACEGDSGGIVPDRADGGGAVETTQGQRVRDGGERRPGVAVRVGRAADAAECGNEGHATEDNPTDRRVSAHLVRPGRRGSTAPMPPGRREPGTAAPPSSAPGPLLGHA